MPNDQTSFSKNPRAGTSRLNLESSRVRVVNFQLDRVGSKPIFNSKIRKNFRRGPLFSSKMALSNPVKAPNSLYIAIKRRFYALYNVRILKQTVTSHLKPKTARFFRRNYYSPAKKREKESFELATASSTRSSWPKLDSTREFFESS